MNSVKVVVENHSGLEGRLRSSQGKYGQICSQAQTCGNEYCPELCMHTLLWCILHSSWTIAYVSEVERKELPQLLSIHTGWPVSNPEFTCYPSTQLYKKSKEAQLF